MRRPLRSSIHELMRRICHLRDDVSCVHADWDYAVLLDEALRKNRQWYGLVREIAQTARPCERVTDTRDAAQSLLGDLERVLRPRAVSL
ncbi:hypothetical protein PsYK624_136580 [Phanerochaete sordida]|uniref:Uncharacterized protein n=1 Tax=Phanerochaete sordida TaxID=48140 RepID=A0A9P3GNF3_9APHY|nr:hypothetical protein PsYK624_136580 [Phanerochaete sordida]